MSAMRPSMILEFPPELMLEIFKRSMPSAPSPPSPREVPLLLAQICHRWREISLDSPELWSSVAFRRPLIDSNHQALVFVELWLSRAKGHPLQLSLEDKSDAVPTLLETAMRWSSQWEDVHLKLAVAAPALLHSIFFPRLRRLSIAINVSYLWGEAITILNAPLLRSVEVTEPNWNNILGSNLDLPWAQLTELLFYTFPHVGDAVSALQECPRLTRLHCRIACVPGSLPYHETAHSLSLNHLRILSSPVQLLPHLTLPSLETLQITDPADARPLVASVVERVLARSFCNLKSLQYDVYHHEGRMGQDLHDLLSVVPTIQRLSIHFSRGLALSRLAKALSSDSPTLVPDLQYLCSSLNRNYAWNLVNALSRQALDNLRLVAVDTGLSIRVFSAR
ncbi:hypothetical protein C8R45DRAFT_1186251 [Mycena sanguinolenta]|nr:hypothetical protein C8R45DRAFT_1186251 [Mycena sanguinolenta]